MTGTPWPAARALAHAAATPLPAQILALADAVGRTLAAALVSATPLPAFDASAMDGYAVAGAGPWQVVRRVLAGHGDPGSLHPGQAAEVATGAPVPVGSDAVLRYEDAVRDGDLVSGPLGHPGRHLRRTGQDIPPDTELLPAGTAISGVVAGLAASVGLDAVRVRQRPRVIALITGDEVVHSGLPGRGRVRDAIGPMLPDLVARHGGALELRLPVPDRPVIELASALESAQAEVVLACGATSAGPADGLPRALAGLRAEPIVDGVACRPGHPQSLWVLPDGRYVIGIPGNPYGALAACHTLLAPLLGGLTGRALPDLPLALLGSPPDRDGPVTRIVPVRWAGARVVPLAHAGPGSLWGAAAADALAAVPPNWSGDPVPLLL
jgi:molybdopterin molybdotransferase